MCRELRPDCVPHPLVSGLWNVHDGQIIPHSFYRQIVDIEPVDSREMSYLEGLFGGYSVYDHGGSLWFLPLTAAMALTRLLRGKIEGFTDAHPTKVAFGFGSYCQGESTRGPMKWMLVDVLDGSVVCGTNTRPPSDYLPAAPPGEGADGLLRWFSEFSKRFEEGTYVHRPMVNEDRDSWGICLFPATGAELSRCVTRGVEVTASCIYMPEHRAQGWGYSLAFKLLGTAEERGFQTCQLDTRIWNVELEGEERDTVRGDGVIGFFPILTDGGWICNLESDPNSQYEVEGRTRKSSHVIPGEFRYQSCSQGSRSMRGQFSGTLLMVPGTRKKPTGEPFHATLNPFRLYIPDFIY